MIGALLMVVVLLLLPVAFFMTGAVIAGALGFFLKKDIDAQYQDSEYLSLG